MLYNVTLCFLESRLFLINIIFLQFHICVKAMLISSDVSFSTVTIVCFNNYCKCILIKAYKLLLLLTLAALSELCHVLDLLPPNLKKYIVDMFTLKCI